MPDDVLTTCLVCRKHRGGIAVPGGIIFEDDLVSISHAQLWGEEKDHYLGHVFVEARRHVPELADLTEQEARDAMEQIMAGKATDAQIGAFLTALRMKGEAAPELIGFARVMREKAEPLWDGESLPVLDTCGTGGDRSGTSNISTAAAFAAAPARAHEFKLDDVMKAYDTFANAAKEKALKVIVGIRS